MSTDSRAALLTEHLRYTPVSLLDDIINSINTLAYKATEAVEKGLLSAPASVLGLPIPEDENETVEQEGRVKHEIENGVHQLETLLEATIDKNFDKMEVFALRSIIAIPEELEEWMRLRHYEGLNFQLPTDAPTLESIHLQRLKVQETQRLHRLLLAESTKNAALISRLRALRGLAPAPSKSLNLETADADADANAGTEHTYPTFGFLENKSTLASGASTLPLSTTTSFALSQLPALKVLLADLTPQLQLLTESRKSDPNISSKSEKSWRRERVEYIEAQTRRHLENVQGLELEKGGAVRDGEWQGEGRRLGKEEVRDLERVVVMVGGKGEDIEMKEEEEE